MKLLQAHANLVAAAAGRGHCAQWTSPGHHALSRDTPQPRVLGTLLDFAECPYLCNGACHTELHTLWLLRLITYSMNLSCTRDYNFGSN